MARYNQKQGRSPKVINRTTLTLGAGFILWLALLIGPLGSIVAVATINPNIVVLFVLMHIDAADHEKNNNIGIDCCSFRDRLHQCA